MKLEQYTMKVGEILHSHCIFLHTNKMSCSDAAISRVPLKTWMQTDIMGKHSSRMCTARLLIVSHVSGGGSTQPRDTHL